MLPRLQQSRYLPSLNVERLQHLDELVDVCVRGGVSLWLHGHRHHNYHTPPAEAVPFPVICAGSVTQRGRWSYKDYTLTGQSLKVVTRVFDNELDGFRDAASYELELPVSQVPASVRVSNS